MIWEATTDQDVAVLAMYQRHYSHRDYADGRDVWQCLGPGNKFALRTPKGDAIFGWRKFLDDCIDERTHERQQGVNCAFFRNEGRYRSSECIRQADAVADALWPDPRHYTYVDPERVQSGLPGACFLAAGWRYVRVRDKRTGKPHRARTKSGLLILERVRQVMAKNDDDGSYLWERCYSCGHRLAYASDSCPQCGIHFDGRKDPKKWPETCECPRCMEARK